MVKLYRPPSVCTFWNPGAEDSLCGYLNSDPPRKIDLRYNGTFPRKFHKSCFYVGRKAAIADIHITDTSLSKAHALFSYDAQSNFTVTDLGSKNGTVLNGTQLTKHAPQVLKAGDVITFGSGPYKLTLKTMGKGDPNVARMPMKRPEDLPVVDTVEFLSKHKKAVCSLAVNPSGSRFVSGSYDYIVKIWDFGGMTSKLNNFKEFMPEEGHIVSSLSFSPTGALFLCVPESSKARVFTREGEEKLVTARGDPYLHDQLNTKGHISTVTCGQWHPQEKNIFLTSAVDGTCRIWDIKGNRTMLDSELICSSVLKAKDARNARVKISACAYNYNGDRIAAACVDGSIQIWNPRSSATYGNPDVVIRPAHGQEMTGVCFTPTKEDNVLVSRGGDDSIALWDVRKLKGPVKKLMMAKNVENAWAQCNVAFSPNGKYVCTGTSTRRGGEGVGQLCFWDSKSSKEECAYKVDVLKGNSVIAVSWNKKTNQIFLGCEDASVRVLYDPDLSNKGVIQAVGRSTTKKRDFYASVDSTKVYEGDIFVPNALPMFRGAQEKMFERKKYKQTVKDQIRKDPVSSRRPDLPPENLQANRNQQIKQMTVTDEFMALSKPKANVLEQDPRQELLKYHTEGETGKASWVEGSYKVNQPKNILAETTMEEEEEKIEKARTNLQDYQEQSSSDTTYK